MTASRSSAGWNTATLLRVMLRELLLATAVAGLAIAWWQDHRTRQAENDDLAAALHFEDISAAFCVNFEERAAMERDYHDRTGRWPAEIPAVTKAKRN